MIRDFLPGNCAQGPAAPVFEQLDREGTDINPTLAELAQQACRSCLQLTHCESQKEGIGQELAISGVGQTVVGAVIVKESIPEAELGPFSGDTRFTFDLSQPLERPEQKLTVIRQGLRSEQIPDHGIAHPRKKELELHLYKNLPKQWSDLSGHKFDTAAIVTRTADMLLRYRRNFFLNVPRRQRYPGFTEDELEDFPEIQNELIRSVLVLEQEGFKKPLKLAQKHDASFYQGVLKAIQSSYEITPGRLRTILYDHTGNPLPKVIQHMQQNRNNMRILEEDPSAMRKIDIREGKSARAKKGEDDNFNWRMYWRTPEVRQYANIMARRGNDVDLRERVAGFYEIVKHFRKAHTDVAVGAIAHFVWHYPEDVDSKIEEYRTSLEELSTTYADDVSILTTQRLESFARSYGASASEEVAKYMKRRKELQEEYATLGIQPSNELLHRLAAGYNVKKSAFTTEDLQRYHAKEVLSYMRTNRHLKVEAWIADKVVDFYEESEWRTVLRHLNSFLKRGYLKVKYREKSETPGDALTPVDSRSGKYLALSESLDYLAPLEQEAVLYVCSLDRIVLGKSADIEYLRQQAPEQNILKWVDELLLPYARAIDYNIQPSPEAMRYWSRERPNEVFKLSKSNKTSDAASKVIRLIKQQPEAAEFDFSNQKDVVSQVRRFVSRLQVVPRVQIKYERQLERLALEYLQDVIAIKRMGIRMPFSVALGYSPSVVKNYIDAFRESYVSKKHLSEMLRGTSSGSALESIRKYTQLTSEMMPHFKARKLSKTVCQVVCRNNINRKEEILPLLSLYDEVKSQFDEDQIDPSIINEFVLLRATDDPVAEIRAWQSAVNRAYKQYKGMIPKSFLKRIVISRRGEQLQEYVEGYAAKVTALTRKFGRHESLDQDVIQFAVYNVASPEKWIEKHIERWATMHAEMSLEDIALPIRRLLLSRYTENPRFGIETYRQLRSSYADDTYIQSWMIERALRWNIGQARVEIRRLRTQLIQGARHYNLVSEVRSEVVVGAHISAEEKFISSQDGEAILAKRAKIASVVSALTEPQKAAVGLVFGISWLADSEEWDRNAIYTHFKVNTPEALQQTVNDIFARLAKDQTAE